MQKKSKFSEIAWDYITVKIICYTATIRDLFVNDNAFLILEILLKTKFDKQNRPLNTLRISRFQENPVSKIDTKIIELKKLGKII